MQTVCKRNMCTGCMACMDQCAHGALKVERSLSTYNVMIQEDKCKKCGLCKKVCQVNTEQELKEPVDWLEGWANDLVTRSTASSGGFAAAMMKGFIRNGGVVCSCVFEKGDFVFKTACTVEKLPLFQGSKYVKSNPMGIYKEIRDIIKRYKILFIGLPCQVAAIKNYIPKQFQERLYTVDLICHGTPSPLLLRQFLEEHGCDIKGFTDIRFRKKRDFRLSDGQWKPIVDSCIADRYSYSFLHAFIYTENCYNCRYARRQRVSDVTIGDSWGSDRKEEKKGGISLALVQSEKGKGLLEMSDVTLYKANLDKAISTNLQLTSPSVKDKRWARFFIALNKGVGFDKAVLYATPYGVFKQNVKKILLEFCNDFFGGGGVSDRS